MATAAKRSSANTDLYIGTLKAAIGLFPTQATPTKTQSFDTAGPNGGRLKYEQRAKQAPVEAGEPVDTTPAQSDPLADALSSAASVTFPDGQRLDQAKAETFIDAKLKADAAAAELETTSAGVAGEFRQVLVEEGSGEEVEAEDVRRGVRLEDGRFIDVTDQIAAIETRTKLDRMEIVVCVDSTQIRRERVIGAYYVGAQDPDAQGKLRVLYESLRKRREVAVVKYTTRSRQQLGVIAPNAKTGTLVLQSLVFSDDWREAPTKAKAIASVQVSERHIELMDTLLASLHGKVEDVDALRDDAVALREELRKRAEAGEMAEVVEPLSVVEDDFDLEGALEASLEAVRTGKV